MPSSVKHLISSFASFDFLYPYLSLQLRFKPPTSTFFNLPYSLYTLYFSIINHTTKTVESQYSRILCLASASPKNSSGNISITEYWLERYSLMYIGMLFAMRVTKLSSFPRARIFSRMHCTKAFSSCAFGNTTR